MTERPTICYLCGKEWTTVPKQWNNFYDFCGTCKKETLEYMENLMLPVLKSKGVLRLKP